ncbi:Transducin/WD40 repeat-like superfamily protein [Raphanus sativus]|nr:Transducin/WD40 repeat-like superfamily protein [Raphanus sativus]
MDCLSQEEDLQFFDASSQSGFDFDPGSVVERRRKFLELMGLEQVLGVESGGCSFSSSQVSSSGSVSNVEVSEELSLRCDARRRQSSSMASCSSDSRCHQVKETEKQSNITFPFTSSKKGWLTRLLSMGCSTDTKIQSGVLSRVKVKHHKKETKELSALYHSQDIKAHKGSISAMKFSCDGKYLASSGEDGIVRVWEVTEDKRPKLQRDYLDPSCMYFEVNDHSQLKPNKTTEKFKKTSDSACVVFPPKAFRIMEKPLHEFHGHTCDVLDISWSRDNYLLSASMDKTVRLWKVGGNACLGVFTHNSYVTCVQFNPVNENYFMSGSCRFLNMSGEYLELDSQIHFHNKRCLQINGSLVSSFYPKTPARSCVSADSKIRIVQGNDVVRRYKGSPKSEGKFIVSTCEDSNVYMWSSGKESDYSWSTQSKRIRSFERFSTNASAAATWCGFSDHNRTIPFSSPPCLSLKEGGSIPKGNATWPEENLPANPLSSMTATQYKFFKSSYQKATSSSLAWGMVIVTGGWDGRIRTFQNYGLPVDVT